MSDQTGTLNGVATLYRARQLAEQGIAPSDPDFETRYPFLFSLLSNNRVEETKLSEPASLRVSNSNGDWLVSLYVPGAGASAEIMVKTFEDVPGAVEKALCASTMPWKYNLKKPPRLREVKAKK